MLQEYNALHSEIDSRHNAQHILINLNITILGLILGFVASSRADPLVLIIIPIVATSFGLLYFSSAGGIERIGIYIRYVLRPSLVQLSGNSSVLSWETFAAKAFRARRFQVIVFAAPIFIIFIGSPIAASVAVVTIIDQIWEWVLWVIGILAEVITVIAWYSFFSGRSIREHQHDAKRFNSSAE